MLRALPCAGPRTSAEVSNQSPLWFPFALVQLEARPSAALALVQLEASAASKIRLRQVVATNPAQLFTVYRAQTCKKIRQGFRPAPNAGAENNG
jgi:hypothetical protein